MVADIFKQLLIEKWKQKEGPKVRYGCTVPGPAAPHKQDCSLEDFSIQTLSKSVRGLKSAQNLDAEFDITQTRAKMLNRPLETKRYACRVLVDVPLSHLPCRNLQKTDRMFGAFSRGLR